MIMVTSATEQEGKSTTIANLRRRARAVPASTSCSSTSTSPPVRRQVLRPRNRAGITQVAIGLASLAWGDCRIPIGGRDTLAPYAANGNGHLERQRQRPYQRQRQRAFEGQRQPLRRRLRRASRGPDSAGSGRVRRHRASRRDPRRTSRSRPTTSRRCAAPAFARRRRPRAQFQGGRGDRGDGLR